MSDDEKHCLSPKGPDMPQNVLNCKESAVNSKVPHSSTLMWDSASQLAPAIMPDAVMAFWHFQGLTASHTLQSIIGSRMLTPKGIGKKAGNAFH